MSKRGKGAVMSEIEYRPRTIDFHGEKRTILYPEHGDPRTALLALANCLLLRGSITAPKDDLGNVPRQFLISRMQRHYRVKLKFSGGDSVISQEKMEASVGTLAGLIDIAVDFTSIEHIRSNTVGLDLFQYLNINLYHGWLVSPENAIVVDAIGTNYHDIYTAENPAAPPVQIENADPSVAEFFQCTGLTPFGMQQLKNSTFEGQIFVLFWNRAFHTLTKHNGNLYSLHNDLSTFSKDAVWKEFNSVPCYGQICTSNFVPVPMAQDPTAVHKCNRNNCLAEFYSMVNLNRHKQVHSKDPTSKMSSYTIADLSKFWDTLSNEEAFQILSIKDMKITEIPGSVLYRIIEKTGAEDGFYNRTIRMKAFLDGIERFSSDEMFALLNEGSEGTAFSTDIRFCPPNVISYGGLSSLKDLNNVLALCCFFVENNVVSSWVEHNAAEAAKHEAELIGVQQGQYAIDSNFEKSIDDSKQEDIGVLQEKCDLEEKQTDDSIELDSVGEEMHPVKSDTALLDNLEEEKQADKSDSIELDSVGEEMHPVKSDTALLDNLEEEKQADKSDTNISSLDDGSPSTGQPNMKTSQRISFEEFVRSKKLTKIYKMRPKKLFKKIKKRVEEVNEYFTSLNRKDKVDFKLSLPILTYSGRRPARDFLQCIIKNHREKKSWNGSFDISDMEIDNGHFIISKGPVFQLTADNASEDFKRFFQLILVPYYKNASLNIYPLYFKEFAEDILKIPDPNVDFDDFLKFEKYLLLHLAFMPPFSRASLLKDVYKVYESIHFKDLHQPRLNKYINRDWREYVKVVPIFSNVYYHGVTAFSDPYTCTYYHLLKYLRHFATHDTYHTKILDTEVQLLSDMIVTDLALGQLICGYLADLVLYVVRDTNMEGSFFRAFHAFEASDGEVFLCAEDDADDESGDSSGDSSDCILMIRS